MDETPRKNEKDLPYNVALNFLKGTAKPFLETAIPSFYETAVGVLMAPYMTRKIRGGETHTQEVFRDNTTNRKARLSGAIFGGLVALGLAVGVGKIVYDMRTDEYNPRSLPIELALLPNVLSLGYEWGRRNKKSPEKKE